MVTSLAGITVVGAAAAPEPIHRSPATLDVYLGMQKVHDSDGAWTAEVAIRDRLFRLAGSVTRYYEAEPDGSHLTMTLPSLVGGVRIDDHGETRVYLELGIVAAKTRHDPVMDTSLSGGLAGIRLEHPLSRSTFLVGEAHELLFEKDVRAHQAAVGIRFGLVQATLRILDFNVGPALWGPEVGLRF